ncbi:MAG TPA: immunoglobulin domain-containing protein [Opitutaceae bacterium]|nr:immunoglobulin domain-containing protein [Opitutaceae bacterium]
MACFVALLLASVVRAQETWTPVSSPTSQTLWGVCSGGDLFVAVGDSGTIVTSPDGITWTKRTSPTTQWLTAVGWSPSLKRFLAVGGGGTFLMSLDGITWTLQTSTSTRRNGVTWGDGRFFVVGEDGFFGSSFDGTEMTPTVVTEPGRWMRGAAVGPGVVVTVGQGGRVNTFTSPNGYSVARTFTVGTGDLEGIVYVNNTFTAVGHSGSVQTSPDGVVWTAHPGGPSGRSLVYFQGQYLAVGEGGSIATTADPASGVWTRRNSPVTQALLGVATNGGIAVAVGVGGTIVRTSGRPVITEGPVSQKAAVGDTVIFQVKATGDNLIYQWSHNGKIFSGANPLVLTNITAANAGGYSVTAIDLAKLQSGDNTATSQPVGATLTLGATPGAVVDPSFVPSSPNTAPSVIAVGNNKIMIGGNFTYTINGQVQRGIARLNNDGSLDTSFAGGGVNDGGMVSSIIMHSDGKFMVGGSFTSISGVARTNLARLNADGTCDTSFTPGVPTSNVTPTLTHLTTDASERIYWSAGATSSYRLSSTGGLDGTFGSFFGGRTQRLAFDRYARVLMFESGVLYRMTSTGSRDFTFLANGSVNPTTTSSGLSMHPNMGVILASETVPMIGGAVGELVRYNTNGTPDPTFTKMRITNPLVPHVDVKLPFLVSYTGKIYVVGDFPALTGSSRTRIARLNADGTVDTTYNTQSGANGRVTALAFDPVSGHLLIAGEFTSVAGVPRLRVARLLPEPGGYPYAPELTFKPASTINLSAGERLELKFPPVGSGPFTYRWTTPTSNTVTDSSTFTLEPLREFHSGVYTVTITGPGGTFTHSTLVNVSASPPRIAAGPSTVSTQTGRTVTLSVQATGGEPFTYQWYRGSTPVGTNSSVLTLDNVSAADVGSYKVVVGNRLGETVSDTADITLDTTSRLAAISTRAFVGPDEKAAIAGFVIRGAAAKRVLIRGAGPALTARFGMTGVLPDPRVWVYNGNGNVVATNNQWGDSGGATSTQMDAAGLFKFDAGSKDAALMLDLAPGNYTVQLVNDLPGGAGIGLIEIYEADNRAERLLAISTRAFVGTGDALTIPGISINGPVPKKVIVRAVGPTMASLGVNAPLADPILTLVNSITGEVIATNDDWSSSANKAEIVAASAAAGNFPLPDPSKDAVVVVTVPPGAYTALVRGANGGTGVALVEVYEVP